MSSKVYVVHPEHIRKDCFGWQEKKCSALTRIWCGIDGECNFFKPKTAVNIQKYCQYCGKPFEQKYASSYEQIYCSRECAYKGRRKRCSKE